MAGTRRGHAQPLTRDRIVDATLAFVDRDGLDALSMRRLGADLGVEAMAIYHHFPNKDALLDVVVDRLVPPAEAPAGGLAWAEACRIACLQLRDAAGAHPRALVLLATRPLDTPALHAWAESPLAAARRAGFSDRQAAELVRALLAYSVGWLLMSRAPERPAAPAPDRVAAVAPDAAGVRAEMADWSRGFEDGMEAILAAWVLRAPPGSGRLARAAASRRGAAADSAGGGNEGWIVQLEPGEGRKKKGGKKRKGKKAKKGS